MASHPDTKIDCSKVYVKLSSFASEGNEFDGAFATVPIKKGSVIDWKIDINYLVTHVLTQNPVRYYRNVGELVEKGMMRRLPDGFDGNTCPYIFTWSKERPNKIWGMGSGCSAYYNTVSDLINVQTRI
jgi:hypothetical protein